MQQHITNLILEMIRDTEAQDFWNMNKEEAFHDIRKQVPDLVTKIMNLMEYGKK